MNTEFIKNTVFKTVGFSYDKPIEAISSDGVHAEFDGKTAKVGGEDESALARAYFLFAKSITEGKSTFCIEQSRHIKSCGVMIDASRNGVMTVEAVKRYINCMATLGLNLLMLYTEDTYEVKELPYFGYMRGRYTKEEIQEIDAYASSLGIELVPCIQTLSHFDEYLKWGAPHVGGIKDTERTVLVDEEETYEFIEKLIASIREMYTTNKIHIGMDEARDLGLGAYVKKHGFEDPHNLLFRHLDRVLKICKKYNFEPMMWSDMFFSVLSKNKTHENYDKDVEITKEIAEKVGDVGLVFWDYYHPNKDFYDIVLEKHLQLSKNIIFAGGLATWYGFLPWGDYATANTVASMQSCLQHNVDTVLTTMWGDNGCETNVFLSLPYLTICSEYCYLGKACTTEDIHSAASFLLGQPYDVLEKMGKLNPVIGDEQIYGKMFIYADILYDIGASCEKCAGSHEYYKALSEFFKQKLDSGSENEFFEYVYLLYEIASNKAYLRENLRKTYQAGDKDALSSILKDFIAPLPKLYERLKDVHHAQWLTTYKPFGWEVLGFRYGGVIERVKEAYSTISDYLEGKLDTIAELEQTQLDVNYPIPYAHPRALFYTSVSELH